MAVQSGTALSRPREVVIVAGVRTAVGKYSGALKDVPPAHLAAQVTREAVAGASQLDWVSALAQTHATFPAAPGAPDLPQRPAIVHAEAFAQLTHGPRSD